jgi:hypothetical protein
VSGLVTRERLTILTHAIAICQYLNVNTLGYTVKNPL